MKNLIGVGVLLKTPRGTYLLQERDLDAPLHPGRIAPFGGGIENGETAAACAMRELGEELSLQVVPDQLVAIGLLESRHNSDDVIQMFLVVDVDPAKLVLHEGKSIVEISKEEALANENVTDFTKEVLGAMP